MNAAATTAASKFVVLTIRQWGHSGLTLVTGGLIGTNTPGFGEVGRRALTDKWVLSKISRYPSVFASTPDPSLFWFSEEVCASTLRMQSTAPGTGPPKSVP